jgi:hypothetical protein
LTQHLNYESITIAKQKEADVSGIYQHWELEGMQACGNPYFPDERAIRRIIYSSSDR